MMDKFSRWAIVRVSTDELITTFRGSFMEVMKYVNRGYEDGEVDVYDYQEWLELGNE